QPVRGTEVQPAGHSHARHPVSSLSSPYLPDPIPAPAAARGSGVKKGPARAVARAGPARHAEGFFEARFLTSGDLPTPFRLPSGGMTSGAGASPGFSLVGSKMSPSTYRFTRVNLPRHILEVNARQRLAHVHRIDLADPPRVTPTRERRGQPCLDDLPRQRRADQPGAEREHVRVVV